MTPETELYRLADYGVVWVYADVYESELAGVHLGQEANLTTDSLPGQTLKGRISFIQPQLAGETRTLPVRMEFPNPDLKFKPGMFVNVELRRPLGRQLTVPVDAVLDSGRRQVVFVDRGGGSFEPREVKLGERTETFVAVLSGLRAGQKVVTRANFLLDSESNLRQAISGMAGMPGMQQETQPPTPQPGMPGMQQEAPSAAKPKGPAPPGTQEHRH